MSNPASNLPAIAAWIGLLVPAYFSPSREQEWNRLADAAAMVPLIAIANVANGPGTASRPDYQQAITRLRAAGGRVIGYVHSTYTQRPLADVTADIDRWAEFYPLDGIFVDEMANDNRPGVLDYYRSLHQHARTRGESWLVIGNPGTRTLETYLTTNAADALVTFENRQGYPGYVPDAWTRRHPATAFAHLCYDIPLSESMSNFVGLARDRGAGWLYITDDRAPNPWDRLPQYWSEEVAHVRELNRDQPIQLSVSRHGNSDIRLDAQSIPGRFIVEISEDLVRWSDWHATGAPQGRLSVVIPAAPGETRFLRVRR
jgi:hypothetical protein